MKTLEADMEADDGAKVCSPVITASACAPNKTLPDEFLTPPLPIYIRLQVTQAGSLY